MIVLRNLPPIRSVQNLILLNRGRRAREDHEVAERLSQASVEIFGITHAETLMAIPEWVFETDPEDFSDPRWPELSDAEDAWEAPHRTFRLLDEAEQAEWLLGVGIDVSEAEDCLEGLQRQIIHVLEGRGGKSLSQVEAEAWAAGLASVSRRPSPSPEQIERNKKMLALGQRKPRAANDHAKPRPNRRAS